MKFIRDIIGEKRQMNSEANGVAHANGAEGILANEALTTEADESLKADAVINDAALPGVAPEVEEQIDAIEDTSVEAHDAVEETVDFLPLIDDETEEEAAEELSDFIDDLPEDLAAMDEEKAEERSFDAGEDAAADEVVETVLEAAVDAEPEAEAAAGDSLESIFRAVSEEMPEPAAETEASDEEEPAESPAMAPLPEPEVETAQQMSAFEAISEVDPVVAAAVAPTPSVFHKESEAKPEMPVSRAVDVPQPAVGRGTSRHGRVKTRLLGFNAGPDAALDPLAEQAPATASPYTKFPVGWLIVTAGAGRGSAFTLFNGVSNIGRGKDQTIRLDFGDNSISRDCHASVAYDPAQKSFYVGHGGKANLVRRNNRPVLSTEEMEAGDLITIGETTLRFVPFCGAEFSWDEPEQNV